MNWRRLIGLAPAVEEDDLPSNLRRDLNTDYLVQWNPETGELVYEPYDQDLRPVRRTVQARAPESEVLLATLLEENGMGQGERERQRPALQRHSP